MILRIFKALIKSLLFIILSCVILISVLSIDGIYKRIPNLISALSPIEIKANIEGNLFSVQKWNNLKITYDEKTIVDIQQLVINFDWGALFNKEIILQDLSLTNAVLNLPKNENNVQKENEFLTNLPEIKLPIDIYVNKINIHEFIVNQDYKELINVKKLIINNAYYINGILKLPLTTELITNQIEIYAALDSELKTIENYPIKTLNLKIDLMNDEKNQNISLETKGSLLKPELNIQASGIVDIKNLIFNADINLARQSISTQLNYEKINYQNYNLNNGEIKLLGNFDNFIIDTKTKLIAKEFPPTDLSMSALIAKDKIENIQFLLESLASKINFTGNVNLEEFTWDGHLKIDNFNTKNFIPSVDLQLNADIKTSGNQFKNKLNTFVEINELRGKYQGQDLFGKGSIHYQNDMLEIDGFNLNVAGNELLANGNADLNNANLILKLTANKLNTLIPQLSGIINGDIRIRGNIQNPEIKSDLNWSDLKYGDNKLPLFSSNKGVIQAQGYLDSLNININLDALGKNIPPIKLTGKMITSLRELKDIDLKAQLLDGTINLLGSIQYSPLSWDIKSNLKKINLQKIDSALKATINSEIESIGSVESNNPNLFVKVNSLSGNWQGNKLQGKGLVSLKGKEIVADELNLAISDNLVSLNGKIKDELILLNFNLNANKLAAIYPLLKGTIYAKGEIKGTIQKPIINLNINGKQIAFNDYLKVNQLKAEFKSGVFENGLLNNIVEINGINISDRNIDSISLKTSGLFEKHQINLDTKGDYNFNLQLNGGFKSLDSWQGMIQQLKIAIEGINFRLNMPSKLSISPDKIKLDNFCLIDEYSNLCATLEKTKTVRIIYDLKKLSPKSFSQFIPSNIKINTELKGKGDINIAKDDIKGISDLKLDSGNIRINLNDQAPLIIDIKDVRINSLFSDYKTDIKVNLDLGETGKFLFTMLVNDFSHPTVDASLSIDIPDISFFKNYIPKIGKLTGNLKGKMRFFGKPYNPQINGRILFDKGALTIPEYATELSNIKLLFSAGENSVINITGKIGTPEGDLKVSGNIDLLSLKLNINLSGENMLLANSKALRVLVTPKFNIDIDPNKGVNIKGKLLIPEAKIDIPDTYSGNSISEDVEIIQTNEQKSEIKEDTDFENTTPFSADINIELGKNVRFKNKDVNIQLLGGLNITANDNESIRGKGIIQVVSGTYFLYGQELKIKRGKVLFSGTDITNPTIDFLALREINDDIKVGASVSGTANNLLLKLTSTPNMPDSSIMSYLVFGKAPDNSITSDDLMNMAANAAISGLTSGFSETFKLDVFNLGLNGLKAGKNISQDLYLGINNDFLKQTTEFITRYKLNKRLKVEGSIEQNSRAIDFTYEYEKD